MELHKTKSEALQILCQYYGQEVTIKWNHLANSFDTYVVDSGDIKNVEDGYYESFSFPNIRSLDEMTEEEKRTVNGFNSKNLLLNALKNYGCFLRVQLCGL